MHAVELCQIPVVHVSLLMGALSAPLLLQPVEDHLRVLFPLLGPVAEELGMIKTI